MDETKTLRRRVVLKGLAAGAVYSVLWLMRVFFGLFSEYTAILSGFDSAFSSIVRDEVIVLYFIVLPFLAEILVVKILLRNDLQNWGWSFMIAVFMRELSLLISVYITVLFSLMPIGPNYVSDPVPIGTILTKYHKYELSEVFWTLIFIWLVIDHRKNSSPVAEPINVAEGNTAKNPIGDNKD